MPLMKLITKILKSNNNICKICFKNINNYSIHNIFFNEIICENCYKEMNPLFINFKLNNIKSLAIYEYNQKIRELLYQFKACKDYELKDIFLNKFLFYLKLKFKNYYLVFAPSFKDHDKDRGYNHVKEIFNTLNLKYIDCLIKTKDIKQANLTFKERENIKDYIKIENYTNLKNKKILLVDDVLTTGNTLKACIKQIEEKKPKKIRILVMAKRIIKQDEVR